MTVLSERQGPKSRCTRKLKDYLHATAPGISGRNNLHHSQKRRARPKQTSIEKINLTNALAPNLRERDESDIPTTVCTMHGLVPTAILELARPAANVGSYSDGESLEQLAPAQPFRTQRNLVHYR